MTSPRTRLAVLLTCICALGGFAASAASAESASVYTQVSCSINGFAGTGTIVFKGSDLLLTSCHTGSQALGQPVVIHSGNCVTVGSKTNVCAGNKQ